MHVIWDKFDKMAYKHLRQTCVSLDGILAHHPAHLWVDISKWRPMYQSIYHQNFLKK